MSDGEITPAQLTKAVQEAHVDAQDALQPLTDGYGDALRSQGALMASRFRAMAQPLTADARLIPPDEDEVIESAQLAKDVKKSVEKARKQVAAALAFAIQERGVEFDVGGVFSDELLDAVGAHTTFAMEQDLRDAYRAVIAQGSEEGWAVDTTADAIVDKVTSMADYRADALARTELNGLANGGSQQAAVTVLAGRDDARKRWLATDDDRTRETHAEADGQEVAVNGYFTVGGAPMLHPGWPFGPAEETINCRCTQIYVTASVAASGAQPSDGLPYFDANEEAAVNNSVTDEPVSVMVSPDMLTDGTIPSSANAQATTTLAADGDGDIEMRDPVAFNATLCVEGVETEDGRLLERGSTTWRDLPLTLMGMMENPDGGWGHDGAKVSGRLDEIVRSGDDINATGELTTAFGVEELAPAIADRTIRGVSIDLAVMEYEIRDRETGEKLTPDEEFLYWLEGKPTLFVVLDGVILGATVCPMPAIANAEISVVASSVDQHGLRLTIWTPLQRPSARSLAAAALAPVWVRPQRADFELAEFPGKTPFTVAEPNERMVRRVFGHLAPWDTCHTGIAGVCTTAPHSRSGYAYYHVGEIETEDGERLAIGKLMIGTKHASLQASRMQATKHYDDNGQVAAYVRVHDGEHGIWMSGVVAPGVTDDDLIELMANPPSGDWRGVDGSLELVAACCVPVPGFPIARTASSWAQGNLLASGDEIELTALIASAGPILAEGAVREALVAAGCGCEDTLPVEGVDDLADLAVE